MVTVVPGRRRRSEVLRVARSAPPADGPPEEVRWHRIDLERYEVVVGDTVVGYIDVVGPVFVALRGSRYDRALEVDQTLAFDRALAALRPAG